ncbi:hypothetical protein KSZ_40730 [Dictyobacter formicarum]|uniref:Uncharacterized protein n=1 Tax=Dictyobacter formicarum TaxID=2778368 RepID=A0ABQ3VIP6_9CHLR|nr:hypothetical protein KSZ_40730 [Dictyobacter formicarum]
MGTDEIVEYLLHPVNKPGSVNYCWGVALANKRSEEMFTRLLGGNALEFSIHGIFSMHARDYTV